MAKKSESEKSVTYEGETIYPLYVRIVFNRKNTRFPYIYNGPLAHSIFTDDSTRRFFVVNSRDIVLQELSPLDIEADFQKYHEQLTKIIQYEYRTLGDHQNVVGIYARFLRYNVPLSILFREEISEGLLDFLEDKLTLKQFKAMQEWEQKRIQLSPQTLHRDDPIEFMGYLKKETDVSDFPIDLRKAVYSLVVFLQFQKSYLQTPFTLYHWLVEVNVLDDFFQYCIAQSAPSTEAAEIAQLPGLSAEDVVGILQRIATQAVNRMYKNIKS